MSAPQLDTKYNWDQLEDKWYSYWLNKKYFHADDVHTNICHKTIYEI